MVANRTVSVAEVAKHVAYGYTASASADPTGVQLLRVTDIASGPVDWVAVPSCEISDKDFTKHRLRAGDIVISRMGTVGVSAHIDEDIDAVPASYLVRIRPDSEVVDSRYLGYVLRSRLWWDYVHARKTGAVQPNLNASLMKSFEFELPSLQEQRRIAHILGTLDDKIELNRRMNQTLEEMARALFKSWFVDFDPVRAKAEGRDPGLPKHLADLFPDRLVDSELGKIPEGWSVRRVQDIAEKVAMGPFGSNIKVETFGTHGVPVISGQHLRGITLEDSSFNFITAEHAVRLAGAIVQRGDVVFTHAGSIGQAAYIPETSQYEKYVISQRQFYMRCDPALVTPEFIALYFNSREGRHRLLANTSSSGVPSIARPVSYLRTIPITVPPLSILSSFNELARPLLGAQEARKGANRTLAQLRDTLLHELVGSTGGTHD